MRYPSKADSWLVFLIFLGPLTVLVMAIFLHIAVLWYAFAGTSLLMLVLVWPCDYTLNSDEMIVRCGLIKFRIPYRDITDIHPTRSPLSSPALSLDRIAISAGRRSTMVSPANKEQFMADLNARVAAARR